MNSASQNRAFLRISAARVAVVGAVATGAAFGLAACGDNADSEMTPSETSMEMSTEKMDGDKMSSEKMDGDKMSSDKMDGEKMSSEKMDGEKNNK